MQDNMIDILIENSDYDGLISLLRKGVPSRRLEIIKALGKMKDKKILRELMMILRLDSEEEMRSACAEAIGSSGNISSLTPLIMALKDESGAVRSRAAEGLGRLKDKRAVSQLLLLLQDENPGVRRIAIHSLGIIGEPKILDKLVPCLADLDHSVRASAAGAMGRLKQKKGIPFLAKLLEDPSDKVTRAAIEGLARIIEPESLAVLQEYKEKGQCPTRVEIVLNQSITRLEKKLTKQEMQEVVDGMKEEDQEFSYQSFKDILEKIQDDEI